MKQAIRDRYINAVNWAIAHAESEIGLGIEDDETRKEIESIEFDLQELRHYIAG